jgi:hypothetical protein
MRSDALAARNRHECPGPHEHRVEHLLGESTGEGVLLADDLRTQDLPLQAGERRSTEVREP